MVREIPLTKGYMALVDDEDFDIVNAFKWRAIECPRSDGTVRVYAMGTVQRKAVYLHRFILNAPKGFDVDHEDRNGLNCRRSNMRLATRSQNMANQGLMANNATGFKGVRFHSRDQRYEASIGCRSKRMFLGYHDDPVSAALAYDSAARRLFGPFASTNFPTPNPEAEAIVAARFATVESEAAA